MSLGSQDSSNHVLGSSTCHWGRYVYENDGILTLLNWIIYSANPARRDVQVATGVDRKWV